jgi:hypothetical protein
MVGGVVVPDEALPGGFVGGAVRVGDTVRKAAPPDAPFVRSLLALLEERGWSGAPRYRGVDDRGREVLSFVDGVVPWGDAAPPVDDAGLAAVARLVRDLSPRNTVFRDGLPVAFIDWDLAGPGLRVQDLAHVCWQFVPLGPGVPAEDAGRRLRVAAHAYGWVDLAVLAETVLWWQDRCWRGIEAAAGAGVPAMLRLRDAGVVGAVRAAYEWTLEHREGLVGGG